jgi:uncharacterized protein YndB with AHSA1/START domain
MIEIEVSVNIDASPERVWGLIGDPTRMGEWSPECKRVEWVGSTRAAIGAKFRGHNRLGWRRWSTTSTLVSYEPAREIAWDVGFGPFPIAHWGYRIEAGTAGCTVVEQFRDRRTLPMLLAGRVARGVQDVESHNRAAMVETLARIKAAAETAEQADATA